MTPSRRTGRSRKRTSRRWHERLRARGASRERWLTLAHVANVAAVVDLGDREGVAPATDGGLAPECDPGPLEHLGWAGDGRAQVALLQDRALDRALHAVDVQDHEWRRVAVAHVAVAVGLGDLHGVGADGEMGKAREDCSLLARHLLGARHRRVDLALIED